MEKIKVGWITGEENWAYKNVMDNISKELDDYAHILNDRDVDVIVEMSPQKTDSSKHYKTIIRLDSKRVFGL